MTQSTRTDSAHLKLLLVEDEDRDIEVVRRSIPTDIQLEVARTMGEARQCIGQTSTLDCAVIDVGLPDGSGLDLIGELEPAPVVVLTGYDRSRLLEEALAKGAQDYLSKDQVTPEVLSKTIAYAIERKRCHTLRQQLEHCERLHQVGMMAAALAHEIGNPATFVRANMELLNHDLEAWFEHLEASVPIAGVGTNDMPVAARVLDAKQLVGEALEGIERISKLVDQLRSICRPTGSTTTSDVNLSEVAHAAIALAGTRVRESARLTTRFSETPAVVSGQSERIGQILSNFLLNAIQALESQPSGNRTIEVAVENHETYGRVTVTDNGPGIPPNIEISQLFRPFMSTRFDQGGSGLGLAVSIQIAESLGGYIDIHRRQDDHGVEAELVLPLVGCPPLNRSHRVTPVPRQSLRPSTENTIGKA